MFFGTEAARLSDSQVSGAVLPKLSVTAGSCFVLFDRMGRKVWCREHMLRAQKLILPPVAGVTSGMLLNLTQLPFPYLYVMIT